MRLKKNLLSLMLSSALMMPGCYDEPEEGHYLPCPSSVDTLYTCDEMVLADIDWNHYALNLGLETYKINTNESEIHGNEFPGTHCVEFSIYDGETGGVGNVLGVISNWAYMKWIGGGLHSISLNQVWTGKTDRGIGIGSQLDDFLQAYPYAQKVDEKNIHTDWDECPTYQTNIWIYNHLKVFFADTTLNLLEVSYSKYNPEYVSPIGPESWWGILDYHR